MTDQDDPLLESLREEVARIEQLVDERLPWPANAVAGVAAETDQDHPLVLRFTWQEVERGRRYVMPLPADRAFDARRSALAELRGLVADARVTVQQSEPRIRYRAGLSVYEVACALRIAYGSS